MEKNLFYSLLFDYYKNLLKDNQAVVIDLYYNQDFSLSEIAEELCISRAGIYDTLKRAEKNLDEFEQKLCLYKRFNIINEAADSILKATEKISDEKYRVDTEYIKREAEKILNEG